ncbi:prohead protease/major capsid protein fusion protein [Tianweitania sediminis]|uniref:Peptidase n=1 Tax=Tianweitania sediminis TaxID=1502156 RepID=A0A8J7UKX9_9HYPH|nr:prohead protease/major capsid protein fusion protein [Tianweitania sediminis]MBP0440159.1 peptidase [Tianweitania sediminis]
MDTMIELPAMRRSAELAPNTADADSRTVEVVWSAGARVRRATFFGEPYDEELSLDPAHVRLDRLNAGAPFLKVHDLDTLDAVIGSVVPGSARIENGRGIALVRISERADVEPIWRDIQAGHIRAVSIGYQVHRFEVSKPEAARELWRAVDWTPFEVSAVAVGADPAAGFRARHPLHDCVLHRRDAPSTTNCKSATAKGPIPMTEQTQTPASDAATPATSQPTEPVETEDTPMTEPKAAAPEPKTAAVEPQVRASETRSQPMTQATPAPDTEAVATRAREAERDRVSTIYDLAGRLNLERGFAEDLVKRGVSVDESRRLILDQVAAKSDETRTFGHVSVPLGGRDERITRRDAVANALLHRYSPTLFQLEDAARQYRGMTLLELARESLGNAGVNTRGLSRDEVATRALHSTSDFPEILSAVTNKTLRQAYDAYPRTFMLFCRQVLATDFKAMHRVQLGEAPQLLEVGESGEFKRGTLGESKESYKVKTYGRVVAITRQTLINDDLDAFTRIPAMYGNSIAQLESDVVWGIITANPAMADGNALFHTSHKNLAGTGAALAVEAVGAARAAMAKQTGLDKKTVLNVRPAFLIVPASLELKAEQLVAQNLVPAATSSVVPQSIRTLAPISEPRLDAASETAWYLAASPNQIDTIEYAYLEGQQGAYIETRNGFDVDGVEIKCRLDFGAKAIDWRGLYKNPGA